MSAPDRVDLHEQARFNYVQLLIKKADVATYDSTTKSYADLIEKYLSAWDQAPTYRLWPVTVMRQRPVLHLRRVARSRRADR